MTKLLICIYLYLIIGLFIIHYNIKIYNKIYGMYITLILFFTLKWIFNYRKCTISYIEYKLRNSKKEDCILYKLLENIMNLRYTKNIFVFYFLSFIILYDYFIIKKNNVNKII